MHCALVAQVDEAMLLELGFTLETEAELLTELVATLDGFTELEEAAIELLLVDVEHTDPEILGFSAFPPLVLPCTPKLTDWPGCIFLFQSNAVAV